MLEIVMRIGRSLIIRTMMVSVLIMGRRPDLGHQRAWRLFVVGFSLVLLDVTNELEALSRFVIIGGTEVEALLKQSVGCLFGFLLLSFGFWYSLTLVVSNGQKRPA